MRFLIIKKILNRSIFRFSSKKTIMEPAQAPEKKTAEPALPNEDDFAKIDIRVGELTEVWKHPESENLYCEKINIGDEIRQIGSGLQKYIKIEDMKGLVCVMANLKPRKLAGFESNGMIICASTGDHSLLELLRPPEGSKVGERVILEGNEKFVQDKQTVLNPKHKILEKCLPFLKTDDNCIASFNGKKLRTSVGYVSCLSLKNANIS